MIDLNASGAGLDGYNLLAAQVQALFADERDFIANAAQFSAFLYNHVDDLNWAGFYLNRDEELVLGAVPGPGGVRAHSIRQGRVRGSGGYAANPAGGRCACVPRAHCL